jgi:hypothetical protein
MASYLERYVQGECKQVWAELVALGDHVREEPLYSDAWAVAQETMRRVRHNFELVIPSLRGFGYVFVHDQLADDIQLSVRGQNWIEGNPPLRTEPPSDIVAQLDAFEREIGPLPLSLRAFYQEVGGVNFVGWYQDMEGFDPVFVYLFDRELVDVDEQPKTSSAEVQPIKEERYSIVVSPDFYHKMDASGGDPYTMRLPNAAADALLLDERHDTTFVDYLRICCFYVGLPDLEEFQCELSEKLDDLRKKMLPI